jgi:hypothetical protein
MLRYFTFSLFALALLLAGCACPLEQGATRTEADQKTGVIRIISNNRTVAYFNGDGEIVVTDMISTGHPPPNEEGR